MFSIKAKAKIRQLVRPMLIVAIVLLACFVAGALFTRFCGIPPHDGTRTTMWMIKRRILRFAHENGTVPNDIHNLPRMPGYDNSITDWWGNVIKYEVNPNGIVTLSSPGGNVWGLPTREGLPISRRFKTKGPAGIWSDEMAPFIEDETK